MKKNDAKQNDAKGTTKATARTASGKPKPVVAVTAQPAKTKGTKPPREKRLSGLDAAAQVLAKAKEPMRCGDLTQRMRDLGLWKPKGKTPAATLNAALIREIRDKGKESRFRKVGRGLFAAKAG